MTFLGGGGWAAAATRPRRRFVGTQHHARDPSAPRALSNRPRCASLPVDPDCAALQPSATRCRPRCRLCSLCIPRCNPRCEPNVRSRRPSAHAGMIMEPSHRSAGRFVCMLAAQSPLPPPGIGQQVQCGVHRPRLPCRHKSLFRLAALSSRTHCLCSLVPLDQRPTRPPAVRGLVAE